MKIKKYLLCFVVLREFYWFLLLLIQVDQVVFVLESVEAAAGEIVFLDKFGEFGKATFQFYATFWVVFYDGCKITFECLYLGVCLIVAWLDDCYRVTDAGLAHLYSLPLQHLSLRGCSFMTDAGLAHFSAAVLEIKPRVSYL